MSFPVLIGLAVGLALDAFAAALGTSIAIGQVSRRQVFRLSFHFGLFQTLMPILGWLAGRRVVEHIQAWDHWAAFGLLAFVGSKAIYGAFRGGVERATAPASDPTRGWSLVLLSTATSVDALAVGLSFAMLNVRVWYPSVVIGVVTGLLTMIAMQIGRTVGMRFGKGVEAVGGLILIGIGLKILIEHLAG